jgi:hypothetical protein
MRRYGQPVLLARASHFLKVGEKTECADFAFGEQPDLERVTENSEHTKGDQIPGDDVVKQFREYQNADASAKADQGCKLKMQSHSAFSVTFLCYRR